MMYTFKPARFILAALLIMVQSLSFSQARVVLNGSVRINLTDSAYLVSRDVTVGTGSTLTVDRSVVKVAGAATSAGTFNVSNGGVELNGSAAQVIPASVFSGNVIKNLTINNTAGTTLSGTLNLTNVLTVSNGQFITAGFFTLKGSATQTGVVNTVTSIAANPITGNVNIERYIPLGKRAYRNLAPGVNTAGNVYENWQNSKVYAAGVGTHVTGSKTAANGFDATYTGAYSLFTYTPGAANFTPFTSTNGVNDKLFAIKGYRLFIRGDRGSSVITENNSGTGTPNIAMNAATTLKTVGTLITGAVNYTKNGTTTYLGTDNTTALGTAASIFSMIGNPYWCPVDFNALSKTDIKSTYWIWDPSVGNRGAYTSYTTGIGSSGGGAINQYIQAGQAVFVQNNASGSFTGNPAIGFDETDKVISFTNTFRTPGQTPSKMKIALYTAANINTGGTVQDAASIYFRSDFSNQITGEDADKFSNPDENLAIANNDTLLGLEARDNPVTGDTIPLRIWNLYPVNSYVLRISASDFDASALAFLKDRFSQQEYPINLNGDTDLAFNFTTDSASFFKRFLIVFRNAATLPVLITNVKAYIHNKGVRVDWQTATESEIKGYEVERSANGTNFEKLGFIKATNNNNGFAAYEFFDASPLPQYNYYRIKSISTSNSFTYSKVVRVTFAGANQGIKILSNPVTANQLRLQLINVPKGAYEITLYNGLNQAVLSQKINHNGDNAAQIIRLYRQPAAGVYQLLVNGDGATLSSRVMIR